MSTALSPRPMPAAEPEPEAYAPTISFQEYVAIMRRRRLLILQAFVLITLVGIIVTFLTKPVYQAEGKLLVDASSNTVSQVDTTSPLSGLFGIGAAQSAATVAEVLQTLPLQQQVFQKDGQVTFGVVPTPDTNVILVQAEGGDARTAASAVNDLMAAYIQSNNDMDVAQLQKAERFTETQSTAAHKSLDRAENQLKTFKETFKLPDLGQNRSDQIALVAGLAKEVDSTATSIASLQARLTADESLLNAQPLANTYTLNSTNPLIESLHTAIVGLQVQRKAITGKGGFNPNGSAPALVQIDAQIAEYQRQISALPKLLGNQSSTPNAVRQGLLGSIADLKGQIQSANSQIASDRVSLAKAKSDLTQYPALELRLEQLTRSRDGASRGAQTFDSELSDLRLREKARGATAHVIQPAGTPQAPVRPKKALNIAFAALIGLFIGICLALLQEFLDDRINTIEDADRILGLPSLGRVPALPSDSARLLPQMGASNAASESYRILRTNINFSSVDTPLKTMLITSSSPGEGKTTTAVNLAFAMAMDGKKVILVDSDLRRPTIHKMLGLPSMPGLTDVLAGTARLGDVLMQHSEMPNLMALSGGTPPPNPSELLGSRAFVSLLETLASQCDMVIMDSPPVLAAADAQILASQVDGVVLVIETGETRKAAARQTVGLLRHARANVLGITYNKLSPRSGDGYYQYNYAPLLTDGGSNGANGTGRNGKGRRKTLPTPAPTGTFTPTDTEGDRE